MAQLLMNGTIKPYLEMGNADGTPLLFLHGILGAKETWAPVMETLCNDEAFNNTHHLLAYSLAGFGKENKNTPKETFNTAIHADELIAFCDALSLNKIKVVAWSYACHAVLLAAIKRPDLFKTILLYECIVPSYGLENSRDKMKAFTRDITRMMAPSIKAIRSGDLLEAANQFALACSDNESTLDSQSPRVQAIKGENLHTLPLLLSQENPTPITPDTIKTIPAKIGILWGKKSRAIFKLTSNALLDALDPEQLIKGSGEIANVHHLLPEENPEQFAELIKPLINK